MEYTGFTVCMAKLEFEIHVHNYVYVCTSIKISAWPYIQKNFVRFISLLYIHVATIDLLFLTSWYIDIHDLKSV